MRNLGTYCVRLFSGESEDEVHLLAAHQQRLIAAALLLLNGESFGGGWAQRFSVNVWGQP